MSEKRKGPQPLNDTERALMNAHRQIGELEADKHALEARLSKMEEALEEIVEWSKAYPIDVFPEPDFKKAAQLLKDGGMTLDGISASNMRHVVEGVGKIAKEALAEEA